MPELERQAPYLFASGAPVAALMRQVLLALMPALLVSCWAFGWGVLYQVLLCAAFCLLGEALVLWLRGRPVATTLADGSVLITALLIALALPPLAPWWMALWACLFAVLIGKQVYGGLGYNSFNPAMAGYAFVLLSFPAQFALWPAQDQALGPLTALQAVLGLMPQADGLSGATDLAVLRDGLRQMRMLAEIQAGLPGLSPWLWLNLAFLCGGLYLLARGVIRWRIPVGVIAGLALPALLFYALDADTAASPLFHLFSGASMCAAFFIATDPVSSPASARAQLIYAGAIGLLIYVIRRWGIYPDGVAFAVLMLNAASPALDHWMNRPARPPTATP